MKRIVEHKNVVYSARGDKKSVFVIQKRIFGFWFDIKAHGDSVGALCYDTVEEAEKNLNPVKEKLETEFVATYQ